MGFLCYYSLVTENVTEKDSDPVFGNVSANAVIVIAKRFRDK